MRRPSPALLVAVVALVAAGAGSATAAHLVTGADVRNESLTGRDVRDRTLRGKDIRANTITGRNVSRLSGRDVIRDGLDGSDIDENTFEAVPRATLAQRAQSADTAATATSAGTADALKGARVVRLAYSGELGSGPVTLYDEGGLRISAECPLPGKLVATAKPTAGGGFVRLTVTHPGSPAETELRTDNDFSGEDTVNLVAGGGGNAVGRLVHHLPTGDTTTIDYLAHEATRCTLAGNALHTTP